MRVGIDLDGCAADFGFEVRETLIELNHPASLHPTFHNPVDNWYFYRAWGMDDKEFVNICDQGVDRGIIFSRSPMHMFTKDAFDLIKAKGHEIHIVTDRSFGSKSEQNTLDWLDRNLLHYDYITFTADKTSVPELDVMVDDKPENFEALNNAGILTYMLTRPWNKHVDTDQRVLDLLHYAEIV